MTGLKRFWGDLWPTFHFCPRWFWGFLAGLWHGRQFLFPVTSEACSVSLFTVGSASGVSGADHLLLILRSLSFSFVLFLHVPLQWHVRTLESVSWPSLPLPIPILAHALTWSRWLRFGAEGGLGGCRLTHQAAFVSVTPTPPLLKAELPGLRHLPRFSPPALSTLLLTVSQLTGTGLGFAGSLKHFPLLHSNSAPRLAGTGGGAPSTLWMTL